MTATDPVVRAGELLAAFNSLVEPAVRAGWWSPGLLPTGLIVLETVGRHSGRPRRVPVAATLLDGCVFVATVLGARSQWMANLIARPEVRYWLGGRVHTGRARVFAPGTPPPSTEGLPPIARLFADGALPGAMLFGWTVAVITGE
jgi:deazaflavin-dependent oxidoreductase (nitroreductase family)